MATKKSRKKESLAIAVQNTLQELVSAAMCFGAVTHPTYVDARKKLLTQETGARLQEAAKAYHEVVVARRTTTV